MHEPLAWLGFALFYVYTYMLTRTHKIYNFLSLTCLIRRQILLPLT